MSINEQELKIIRSDIQDLKAEISLLNQNFSAIEELMRLIVTNQTSNNVEIKNFNEHFQQLQKAIDAQKLNHRLYFDNVENSLSALKILLENTLSPKISAIEKSIDAESQNNSLNNKNISSLEELMRLIVANQMLNNVEIKKSPPKTKEVLQGRANIYAVGGFLYAVMLSGKILSDSMIKVIRSGKIIFNTKISYLDSSHQGTREINYGYFQCKLFGVDNNKIEENDIIEAYTWE